MRVGSDGDDWAGVLAGEGEAFGRVFDRHKDAVRRQVRRLLDRPVDVEDVVAVVFFEAWHRRNRVTVVDGSLRPWLLVTAANVARNARRSRIRYEGLLARLPTPPDIADPASSLDDRHVLDAMRMLPVADQQVLTLCVLEGWSERDAAAALHVPPGTVKSRLHRAKRRLAREIDQPAESTPPREARNGI